MEVKGINDVTDSDLVRMSLEKDNDAYGELMKRWMSAVMYSAYSVTENEFSAEDIAQEAFFGCWFKLHMLREHEKFGAWVCRVAKNHALNSVTRSVKQTSLDSVMNMSSKGSSPENILIMKETKAQINGALRNLPEKSRETAEMFYITGLSQKQIASLLDIPEGTVKRRLFDARNRLKSELEKLGVIELPRDKKLTGDKIMTQKFIEKVNEKIDALKEQVDGNKFFHLGENYRNSLAEAEKLVDSMDECNEKQDALVRLYYYQTYIDASDEAFEKAFDAACKSNDLKTIQELVIGAYQLNRESGEKLRERIEKILPMFEGSVEYGNLVFWYAKQLMAIGDYEESKNQFRKVTEIFEPTESSYYPNAIAAIKFMDANEKYGVTDDTHYKLYDGVHGMKLVRENHRLIMREQPGFSSSYHHGNIEVQSVDFSDVLVSVTGDKHTYFIENMKIGDKLISEDEKTTLEMVSDNETVSIKVGIFSNCHKLIKHGFRRESEIITEVWYCPNIGVIKAVFTNGEITESYELDDHTIVGGNGLLPLEKGNYWSYKLINAPDLLFQHIEYTVESTNQNIAFISTFKLLALKKQT